jgi:hypothetical protein
MTARVAEGHKWFLNGVVHWENRKANNEPRSANSSNICIPVLVFWYHFLPAKVRIIDSGRGETLEGELQGARGTCI